MWGIPNKALVNMGHCEFERSFTPWLLTRQSANSSPEDNRRKEPSYLTLQVARLHLSHEVLSKPPRNRQSQLGLVDFSRPSPQAMLQARPSRTELQASIWHAPVYNTTLHYIDKSLLFGHCAENSS